MRVISLFSGAGGLDLGLIQSGNVVIWANDIDANAVATYRKNIGDHIVCADIKDVQMKDIPDAADVVVGGFPCQGFSQANLLRDVDDDRNVLYKFFRKVIVAKKPKFFIAENVKGILSLGGGAVIKKILADFQRAGYRLDVHLVDMAYRSIVGVSSLSGSVKTWAKNFSFAFRLRRMARWGICNPGERFATSWSVSPILMNPIKLSTMCIRLISWPTEISLGIGPRIRTNPLQPS